VGNVIVYVNGKCKSHWYDATICLSRPVVTYTAGLYSVYKDAAEFHGHWLWLYPYSRT